MRSFVRDVNNKLKLGTHNDSYRQINCIAFRKKELSELSYPSLDHSFLATRKPIYTILQKRQLLINANTHIRNPMKQLPQTAIN
jgi:hypothetical protein